MHQRLFWRYLLVDVDGTLLNSRGEITPRTQAVLRRAVEAGLTLVLASGRTYPSLWRIGQGLALPFHLIANGGAVGMSPYLREVEYTCPLPSDLWPELYTTLTAEGLSAAVFVHRHPEPPLIYTGNAQGHPHFESYLGRHADHVRVVPDLARTRLPDVVEVAALGSGEAFDAASQRVIARFAGRARGHSMVLFLNAHYGKITEFFHADSSKWHAFLGMFPQAAVHPERVIAVGDEANDLEMIRDAGLGIVMGNAVPELKAVADLVTADHDHDGIAVALEPLLDGRMPEGVSPAGQGTA